MRIKFIQKLIDKIRNKVPENSYIHDLGAKIISYEKVKKDIDTIILGSSHAQLGYRAKSNEFNLGLSFQDLYCSYNIYKKYSNEKIKNIILFYSVFSPGSQTIKSQFADKMAVYKAVLGFNYQDNKSAKEKKLYNLDFAYKYQYLKFKKKYKIDLNYRGNEVSYITCFKPPIAADRAKPHYKNNQRNNNQTEYVVKMQKLADKRKANLYVVISPATTAYKNSLPLSSELFKELFYAAKKYNINLLNMYDSDSFDNSDFEDWDHLSLKGAIKLTNIINEWILNTQQCR